MTTDSLISPGLKKILYTKYSIVARFRMNEFDTDFKKFEKDLLSIKKDHFDADERILIEHVDTDYYLKEFPYGINLYNLFTAFKQADVPLFVMLLFTNNFGIQRWVYVLVSVNTNIVDAYLDGKLVNSTQLNGIPNISCPSNNWAINYGSGDIYISNFKRWTSATDPATALSYYRQTRPASSKIFSSYSANVQLSVDNVPQQPIKIF